jgi:tetratricopeptide (TPR) repeat protein
LKNIFSAEGLVFCVLIALGIVWVLVRRNKSNAFLALSGLAYFLGALGFLGFSRYRDIPPLTVIYSFLGMLGLQALYQLFKNPRLKRVAIPATVSLIILCLEYSALAKTYYLWEDDTTEIAERWIRRNIPEGSYFGKEWFSPPTAGKDYSYPSFSAPFLYSRNFAPYDRFDFIITSSAANGHFFRNQKFYPDVIRIYKNLREKNELIKRFYFKDFEYKNPELNIFSTASQNRPKQRLSLPIVLPPDNLAREFEVSDGSPYGKDVCSFFLEGRQEVTRIIISPKKIREMAVFVTSLEGNGEVVVRSFLSKKRLSLKAGQTAYVLVHPKTCFPFFKYLYKITFRASRSLGKAVIKLDYDEFKIGLEFFRQEDYQRARRFFLRALENRPRNSLDLEVYFFLARCSERLGFHQESQKYLKEASASPFIRRYVGLFQPLESNDSWIKAFEKMSGIDFQLLEQTLTATIDDGDFKFNGGIPMTAPRFHRSTAFLMSGDQEGKPVEGISPEIWALPQDYRLEFIFYNPSQVEGLVGELEIVSTNGEKTEHTVFPVSLSPTGKEQVSSASFFGSAKNLGKSNRFLIRIDPARNLAFDYVKIIPDIRTFFDRKCPLIQHLLEGGDSTSSDGRE